MLNQLAAECSWCTRHGHFAGGRSVHHPVALDLGAQFSHAVSTLPRIEMDGAAC